MEQTFHRPSVVPDVQILTKYLRISAIFNKYIKFNMWLSRYEHKSNLALALLVLQRAIQQHDAWIFNPPSHTHTHANGKHIKAFLNFKTLYKKLLPTSKMHLIYMHMKSCIKFLTKITTCTSNSATHRTCSYRLIFGCVTSLLIRIPFRTFESSIVPPGIWYNYSTLCHGTYIQVTLGIMPAIRNWTYTSTIAVA